LSYELGIALYGAIVATVLGIIEICKGRKRLSIILEHIAFYETVQIIITNTSNRPITISSLSMETLIGEGEKAHWEIVPQNAIFDRSEGNTIPLMIKLGESISLPLGHVLSNYLLENNLSAKLTLYDSEGKKYTKFKARTFNAKWGDYHYEK